MERIERVVLPQEEGLLLRDFLRQQMGLSKKQITRLKACPDGIWAQGVPVGVRHRLTSGECVSVQVALPEAAGAVLPHRQALSVIYEDDALLVVDKPAQLTLYPSYQGHLDNLASAVLAHWQQNGGPAVFRPLMRLDKDTSGLVVIAKSAYVLARLQQGPLIKEYLAWAGGDLDSGGTIEAPIAKGCGHKRQVSPDGRYARTDYEVLWRGGTATLLALRLHTGRTHQIRVHLAHIGHPLLGDALYGGDCTYWRRHALHASRLTLIHPLSGQPMAWESLFAEGQAYKDIVLSQKEPLQTEQGVLK